MDIWIIQNGEKIGPLHDFEIRRKIETGELPRETPAWHEGLAGWKSLAEIEVFSREFELAAKPSTPTPDVFSPEPVTPPPLPVRTFYLRRFWARWLDLSLYSAVWWLGMWTARQDIGSAWLNQWVMFFQLVPWFAGEALLLHYFTTTPGKWLLGLRVVNKDGSRLDLAATTRRSLRVMFTGIGFGWGLLAVFCQALSLFAARRLGTTLWDHSGGHQVNVAPLKPLRILTLVLLFFAALQLQMAIISPHVFELVGQSFPELKKEYDKNPPWHLPKRSK